MTRQSKNMRLSIFCVVVFAFIPSASARWKEQVLYSFQGLPDGATPVGGMVFDKQGNLYGATADGGSSSCVGPGQCGTVFQLSPPARAGDSWTETVLYVFKGRNYNDGATPEGGLVMDAAGNLYGTTGYDGTGTCKLLDSIVGCGVVYELSPPAQPGGPWTETVLYSFQGGNDGYVPNGDLVFDKAGNLYGATLFGGGKGTNCNDLYGYCGTVFELSPPKAGVIGGWTEKVLYSFAGIGPAGTAGDGGNPNGGLVFDEAGIIYGTTYFGGSDAVACGRQGCGIAFELIPQKSGVWRENVMHRFQGEPDDGFGPNGNLILANGMLFGTTVGGGSGEVGTVYSLGQAKDRGRWVETTQFMFLNGHNPNNPAGGLTLTKDGDVLGTASNGGSFLGGALFRLIPPLEVGAQWNILDLYNFERSPDGAGPFGKLITDGGNNLYGMTQVGGTGQLCNGGCGTVFEITP